MNEDDFDDGFVEIERDTPSARLPACSIKCSEIGRGGQGKVARRVSLTFRFDKLDPEVRAILEVGRLAVAFNESAKAIRIRKQDGGQYEATEAPRGGGNVYLLRFPFPKRGMEWCSVRTEIELDVNPEQHSILIDLPAPFCPQPQKQLPPPTPPVRPVDRALQPPRPPVYLGEPAPGRSALDQRRLRPTVHTEEDDKHMLELLGVTGSFPRKVYGTSFTPSEAAVMEALLKRVQVGKSGILLATWDPAKGEDERDEKIVDVIMCKLKKKATELNIDLTHEGGGSWSMNKASKDRLRFLLQEDGYVIDAA